MKKYLVGLALIALGVKAEAAAVWTNAPPNMNNANIIRWYNTQGSNLAVTINGLGAATTNQSISATVSNLVGAMVTNIVFNGNTVIKQTPGADMTGITADYVGQLGVANGTNLFMWSGLAWRQVFTDAYTP